MRCSSCGADLPDRALRCPECESPVTDAGDDDKPEAEQSQSTSFQADEQSTETDTSESSQQPDRPQPNPRPTQERQGGGQPASGQSQNAHDSNQSQRRRGQPGHQKSGKSDRQASERPAQRGPAGSAERGRSRQQGQATQQGQSRQQRQANQQGRSPNQGPAKSAKRSPGQPAQEGPGQSARQAPGQPAQQSRGRSLGDRLGSVPFVGGLFYGIIAFVVNFFVTAMLVVAAAEEGDLDGYIGGVGDQGPGLLEVFGWFFYSAHNVDITAIGGGQSSSENFIEVFYSFLNNPSVPKIGVYLAPALVLFVLALVLVSRVSFDEDATALDGAFAGGSIAIGYAALTLVGAVALFSYTTPGGDATVQPVLGSAVVFMCLLYPVVSGGLAGLLVGR